MLRKNKFFAIFCFFFIVQSVFPQDSVYKVNFFPEIKSLNSTDVLFLQFCSDVEKNYQLLAQFSSKNAELENSILFYKYTANSQDTFFTLAARFNVGQETLATLNHIALANSSVAGTTLIIPNCKGLFISEKPKTQFEKLLKSKCAGQESFCKFEISGEMFDFYPNYQIGQTERSFFLDKNLRMPVTESVLTSGYGMRISPISGKPLFHKGVDLACPEGSEVFACGNGTVENVGYNNDYGNFVVIHHADDKFSFYAHLSAIIAKKNDFVQSGDLIGKVGSTGASTGPHLHFEIREGSKNIDPFSILPQSF